MAVHSYDQLKSHVGHNVVVAQYGDPDDPDNVAIECEDCHVVIMDYDKGESDF